jgi:hypothetical protein
MPNDDYPFTMPARPVRPTPDISPNPVDTGRSGSSIPIPSDILEEARRVRREPLRQDGERCPPTPDMPGWTKPKT